MKTISKTLMIMGIVGAVISCKSNFNPTETMELQKNREAVYQEIISTPEQLNEFIELAEQDVEARKIMVQNSIQMMESRNMKEIMEDNPHMKEKMKSHMQKMMEKNPEMKEKMQSMMIDQTLKSPKGRKILMERMNENPEMAKEMMGKMMDKMKQNPEMMEQMIENLMENSEMREKLESRMKEKSMMSKKNK